MGLLTVFSALYPRRSMGFEAYLLALLTSLLDVAVSAGKLSRRGAAREITTARVGGGRIVCAGVAAALAGAFLATCGVALRSVLSSGWRLSDGGEAGADPWEVRKIG